MKLLYISSNVAAIHLNLLNALEKVNINTILCTYTTNQYAKEPIQAPNTWYYKGNSHFRGPVLYLHRLKKAANYFLSKITTSEIDILHGNMMFGDGYICREIYKKTNIPYVLSVRNTDLNLWFLWKLPWIKNVGIDNLLCAKAVIFLSSSYKKVLLNRLPHNIREKIDEKSFVIPNGIDDFWFNNREKKNIFPKEIIKFITVGRIEENKNQVAVAEALSRFRAMRRIDISYTVVGDCKDENMKKRLADFDFVKIIPFQDKEVLINRFRENDIYIMPSHTETFGLVYAEAMTQGLPVIYTRGQGFDEQFAEGIVGYSVDSRNIESILEGIEKVVDHFDTLADNVCKKSDKFIWNNVSDQLIKVYNALIVNK